MRCSAVGQRLKVLVVREDAVQHDEVQALVSKL